jgi:ankyrin repeat protein
MFAHVVELQSLKNDPGFKGMTPLALAAQGQSDIPFSTLVQNGFALDTPDNLGRTPLMYLAMNNVQLTPRDRTSLQSFITPNILRIKDGDGKTALHHAENVHHARLLLDYGGDLHARDNDGRTPLFTAGSHSRILFLNRGCSPGHKDHFGCTAVFFLFQKYLNHRGSWRHVNRLLNHPSTDHTIGNSPSAHTTLHILLIGTVTLKTLDCILQRGGSLLSTTCQGETPLSFLLVNTKYNATEQLGFIFHILTSYPQFVNQFQNTHL